MAPLSYETIYGIIAADRGWGNPLANAAPTWKKARRDRTGDRLKVGPEEELVRRSERVNDRSGPGHWEAALVIGAQQVAVERVTLLTRLRCLPFK